MTQDEQADSPSPFHAGEVELQRRVGVAERMDAVGRRVIRDFMPDQHRDFYAQLPFVVAATVDAAGDVWATAFAGAPGFMHSPESRILRINTAVAPDDPAMAGIAEGGAIGLLGIELQSRRRNRMNGHLSQLDANGFTVMVEHSFGNCPQYIQRRNWLPTHRPEEGSPEAEFLVTLDATARHMIAGADTFFVASFTDLADGRRQVDVSHRGGRPGFVRIGDDETLTIPDFAGNLHFNTLGNFLLNPRAGLVFVDFESGDMLQLTGTVEVLLDSPDIAAFQGAKRLWTFTPTTLVRRKAAFPLRFEFVDWSPRSLMTGDWSGALPLR